MLESRKQLPESPTETPTERRMTVQSLSDPSLSEPGDTATGRHGFKSGLVRRSTTIRWVSIAILLASLVTLTRVLPMGLVMELARGGIEDLGIWGPLALAALYVLATLLFVPGSLLTLAAGAVYGLMLGTVIVSLSSTLGAALAFLIARHAARDRVREMIRQSPKLAAVDAAIGQQGWKIVALLRLSPAVPFNLQNYLYGVTAIRFWPCVLVSWVAMLPGTFLYVYIGSLGHSVATGRQTSPAEWALRGVGLIATILGTIYLARLAGQTIRQHTDIELHERQPSRSNGDSNPDDPTDGTSTRSSNWPWATLLVATLALAALLLTAWAIVRRESLRQSIERLLATHPAVVAPEALEPQPKNATFDHAPPDGSPLGKPDLSPGKWPDSQVQMTAAARSVSGDHQPGSIILATQATAWWLWRAGDERLTTRWLEHGRQFNFYEYGNFE